MLILCENTYYCYINRQSAKLVISLFYYMRFLEKRKYLIYN